MGAERVTIATIGGNLTVSRIGLGTLRLAGFNGYGRPLDASRSRRVLRRAIELGVQLIDTADAYGPEIAEELIFEALHPYPSDLVIATKGGVIRQGRFSWLPNGQPEHLRRACEASLLRVGLDWFCPSPHA